MSELKKYCERIREELERLYESDFTDEERERMEEEGEAVDLYSYFDDTLDVEYTLDSQFRLIGVKVWVTLGGPNVWIDTREQAVKGAWGSDREEVYIDSDICAAIDEIFDGIYNCR